jgi:hypothetical protein
MYVELSSRVQKQAKNLGFEGKVPNTYDSRFIESNLKKAGYFTRNYGDAIKATKVNPENPESRFHLSIPLGNEGLYHLTQDVEFHCDLNCRAGKYPRGYNPRGHNHRYIDKGNL